MKTMDICQNCLFSTINTYNINFKTFIFLNIERKKLIWKFQKYIEKFIYIIMIYTYNNVL